MTDFTNIPAFKLAAHGSVGVEQLAAARHSFRFALGATVVNSLVIALALNAELASAQLWLWAGLIWLLAAARAIHLRGLEDIVNWSPLRQLRWQRGFVFAVVLSGLLWASLLWLVTPQSSFGARVLVIVVLAGMMAASSLSYSSILPGCYGFVVSIGLGLVIRLPEFSGGYHLGLLLLATLFTVMCALIGRQHKLSSNDLYRARREISSGHQLLSSTRSELQQRDSLLEAVLQQAEVLVLVTDKLGKIAVALGRGFNNLGLHPKAALGRPLGEVFGTQHELLRLHQLAKSGESTKTSIEIGGASYDVLASPFANNNQAGCLLVGVDSTERIRFRRLQEHIVSNVNHELRTPLTPLKGALDLLQLETGHLTEPQLELLAMAQRNLDRLRRVTEQIAATDPIVTLSPNESIDSSELERLIWSAFGRVVAHCQTIPELHLVNRANDSELTLDRATISQLFEVLLDNAARYALADTPIVLSIEPGNQTLIVAIANHGPAIDRERRGNLFERFVTADDRDERPGGLGMGLHLAERIVESHGGRLWLETSDGNRTEFRFTLPVWLGQKEVESA